MTLLPRIGRLVPVCGVLFGLTTIASCDEEEEATQIQDFDDPQFEIKMIYSRAWCGCYWNGNYDSEGQCLERHPGMYCVIPCLAGCLPVRMLARVGEHIGLAA